MNKFKIGDKIISTQVQNLIFEIETEPDCHNALYKFKERDFLYDKYFVENCFRLITQEEINALCKKQFEHQTQNQPIIICPWCLTKQDSETFEFCFSGNYLEKCEICNEKFNMVIKTVKTFSTERIQNVSN